MTWYILDMPTPSDKQKHLETTLLLEFIRMKK